MPGKRSTRVEYQTAVVGAACLGKGILGPLQVWETGQPLRG
jgi:hypothetical protein